MPISKKVNKQFFKSWSNNMAYVLGFFIADGYITHSKRGSHFWSIDITDKDLLHKIRSSVESDHTIGVRYRKGNENVLYRLQIGSKEMCKDLKVLGVTTSKTNTIVVPAIPKEYVADFVRGYFDGDGNVWVGHVHKERKTQTYVIQVTFTSVSKSFLLSLKDLLSSCGVVGGSLYTHGSKNFSRLSYSNRNASKIYKMMYNTETSLFLFRKKEVFERYFNQNAAVAQR